MSDAVLGSVVQTVRRIREPYMIRRGTRGLVTDIRGDELTVQRPDGTRFRAMQRDVSQLLKSDVDL